MYRTDVRNRYKLFGIISKDPIGKYISMVVRPTAPTAQFFLALARIRGIAVEVVAVGTGQALALGEQGDADVLLVVTDLFSTPIPNDELFTRVQQQQTYRPIVVVLNKVDLVGKVNAEKVVAARAGDASDEEPVRI